MRNTIYFKLTHPTTFPKNTVVRGTHDWYIIVNPECKDAWWRKILRFFGFKIFNPEGHTKVKKYVPKAKSV